jgi:hypothetical protein
VNIAGGSADEGTAGLDLADAQTRNGKPLKWHGRPCVWAITLGVNEATKIREAITIRKVGLFIVFPPKWILRGNYLWMETKIRSE